MRTLHIAVCCVVSITLVSPLKAEEFLWGAATSSYQVEGGIDCSDPSLPCNDYDFSTGIPK